MFGAGASSISPRIFTTTRSWVTSSASCTASRGSQVRPSRASSPPRRREEQETFYARTSRPRFDHWFVRATDNMPVMLFCLGIPPHQFSAMEADAADGGMPRCCASGSTGWPATCPSAKIISAGRPSAAVRPRRAAAPCPSTCGGEFPDPARQPAARQHARRQLPRVYARAAGRLVRPLRFPRRAGLDAARADRRAVDRNRARRPPGSRIVFRTAAPPLARRGRAAGRDCARVSTTRKTLSSACMRKTAPPFTADSTCTRSGSDATA